MHSEALKAHVGEADANVHVSGPNAVGPMAKIVAWECFGVQKCQVCFSFAVEI